MVAVVPTLLQAYASTRNVQPTLKDAEAQVSCELPLHIGTKPPSTL